MSTVGHDEPRVDAVDRVLSWPAHSIREVHELEPGVLVTVAGERWLAIPSSSFTHDEQRQRLIATLRSFMSSERPFEPRPARVWPEPGSIFGFTVGFVVFAIAAWWFETLGPG